MSGLANYLRRPTCRTLALVALLLPACWGCGSAVLPVSGTATVEGKPIDRGTISFQTTQATGPTVGTAIVDGRFNMEAPRGLAPGEYLARVYALRATGKVLDDPQRGKIDEYLPWELAEIEVPVTVTAENASQLQIEYTPRQ